MKSIKSAIWFLPSYHLTIYLTHKPPPFSYHLPTLPGIPTSIGPTLQQKSAPLVQWLPPRMGVPTAAVKFSSVEGGFFPLFCYVEAQNSDGENSMEVCFKQKTSQNLMLPFSFQTLAPATKFESNRKTLRNRFQQFHHFLLNNNGQTLPFVMRRWGMFETSTMPPHLDHLKLLDLQRLTSGQAYMISMSMPLQSH